MNLKELRERYPFKPYQLVLLGERLVEVISYPWPEGEDSVRINVRMVPGDPTTMTEVAAARLTHTVAVVHPDPVRQVDPYAQPVHVEWAGFGAPTSPAKAGLGAFPTEPVDPDGLIVKVQKSAADALRQNSYVVNPRFDMDGLLASLRPPDPEPEPVDPDSVDGLIARLQALPADVRKLPVRIPDHDGEEMVKVRIRVVEAYGENEQPETVVVL